MTHATTTTKSAAVEVAGVSKWHGEVHALDGVSLAVQPGEMFGLIGPNGAGKSTLFKLMLGLVEPGAGAVRVHGVPIGGADFRAVRRRIGYLPESFVTYDNLSGMEVLVSMMAKLCYKSLTLGHNDNITRVRDVRSNIRYII